MQKKKKKECLPAATSAEFCGRQWMAETNSILYVQVCFATVVHIIRLIIESAVIGDDGEVLAHGFGNESLLE